jgi:hypothetical protein
MAETTYTVLQLDTSTFEPIQSFSSNDTGIVESFVINSLFDQSKHNVEVHFYSLDNILLESIPNFEQVNQYLTSAGAGKQGASNVSIDVVKTALQYGYEAGDVRVLYRFTNDLFSDNKTPVQFYIDSISGDRTEIRAFTNQLTDQQLSQTVSSIKERLNSQSFFSEFFLNFSDNSNLVAINIDSESTEKGIALTIKLYQPLPQTFIKTSTFFVEEEVSDEVLFEVSADIQQDVIRVPFLKGPNFSVEVVDENTNPSEYLNYNELFSYPVTNSYFELRSLFDEKSAQIAIDHTDYSDFVHFSSAEERLRNFKYKLDLITSYQSSLDAVKSTNTSQTGSITYYEELISGVILNFDHYDRYLYYESSSYAWPKQNLTRPYINQPSSTNEANTWFTNQLVTASLYDTTNFDILTNTIPAFVREDPNNEPYLMFVHMIGQHFDNLWIYVKAVSDKYDADNRLNFGVSKDLVKDALESLGIKLYNSNQSLDNLFSIFTGENYPSGSEVINTLVNAVSGSGNEYLQPVPKDSYLKEVYKRIYHNIPLILKSKGTERGLRALINSFGIPSDILQVKIFGGVNQNRQIYPGLGYVTGSLDKIRIDNTGSIATGSTLSQYTSTVTKDNQYSDDLHTIEIGFDLSQPFNSLFVNNLTGSFTIDDYIGDPRDSYQPAYSSLVEYTPNLPNSVTRDIAAFIRLAKFFDNSIFRIVKDFIPARTTADVGIIVKSNILNRSKAKQVEVSYIRPEYTGSVQIGSITGSHGDSYVSETEVPYTTAYNSIVKSPIGTIPRSVTDESPKFNGELSGSNIVVSTAELNDENLFKKVSQPITRFSITVFNLSLPIPPSCALTLVARYQGEYFTFYAEDGGGTVQVIYPVAGPSSTDFITHVNNYNVYEFFSVEASPVYPQVFFGWFTLPNGGGVLVESGTTLTVTRDIENLYGTDFYANFEGENYY